MENKQNLRILFLEDNPDDAGLVVNVLKRGGINFNYERVETKKDFIRQLKNYKPDVILSDHSLPQFNSTEAFEIYSKTDCMAPFILVTGAVSEEFAVSCIKKGIDDYILKSNLTRLPLAINHALHQKKLESSKLKSDRAIREQNQLLLKINSELDNFAYNVSHNLKAPLTSVMGLINLIKIECKQKGEEPSELISMMEYSLRKLDLTLVSILNYSRNSRMDLQITSIDFNEIFNDCLHEVRYFNGFDDIKKNIRIENPLPFRSDKYRISVIITNILSNAVKYYDPGKPGSFINIEVTFTDHQAKIKVEDNGIGINGLILPNIFNMFYRGTERSDGAGLGLYIVKEMIDRLSGTIEISSVEEEGTTILISLPELNFPD